MPVALPAVDKPQPDPELMHSTGSYGPSIGIDEPIANDAERSGFGSPDASASKLTPLAFNADTVTTAVRKCRATSGLPMAPIKLLTSWRVDPPKTIGTAYDTKLLLEADRTTAAIPLLYEKCSLPEFLKGKLYADFTNPKDYESVLAKLLRRLRIT